MIVPPFRQNGYAVAPMLGSVSQLTEPTVVEIALNDLSRNADSHAKRAPEDRSGANA